MIRIICLNPVVDRMYYINDFRPGVLHKAIPPAIYPGGKGVNIARVVSQLGEECELYTFLGGSAGSLVKQDMLSHGVKLHEYWYEGETRSTINIIDNANRSETEITEPGTMIPEDLTNHFLSELRSDISNGDIIVCSGSIVSGMSDDIYKTISRITEEKGGSCMLDTSSKHLKASFPASYSFIKPNLRELNSLFDVKEGEKSIAELASMAMEIGAESIMVSAGAEGCYFFHGDTVLKASVPDKPVVSTIGSGDSSVAGFCTARAIGLDDLQAVRLSMACGVSNAMHSEVGYIDRKQVEELLSEIEVTRE